MIFFFPPLMSLVWYNISKNFDHVDQRHIALIKIASVRDVVLGAPLRLILKQLASRTLTTEPDVDQLIALVHRPMESFFLVPQVRLFPVHIILSQSFSNTPVQFSCT